MGEPAKPRCDSGPLALHHRGRPNQAQVPIQTSAFKRIADEAKAVHRDKIRQFAQSVRGDEVRFAVCHYRNLLAIWSRNASPQIREHAKTVVYRHLP